MNGPWDGIQDWWMSFARGFPGQGGVAGAGEAWGPFVAACGNHAALMQGIASSLAGASHDSGVQELFERLRDWQQQQARAGQDPFAVPGWGLADQARPVQSQLAGLGRLAALQARVLELQGRMLAHGADIARDAMQRFAACAADAEGSMERLHAAWIDSAEQAYAQRVRRDDYCREQAELVNAGNALRQAQREQLEEWARFLDLPTRSEMNALIGRVVALEAGRGTAKPKAKAKAKAKAKRRPGTGRRR